MTMTHLGNIRESDIQTAVSMADLDAACAYLQDIADIEDGGIAALTAVARLARAIRSFQAVLKACFSFGNGCQAIEIARAFFARFFQMRLEIVR
jgi:hypothetical protein